MNELSKYSDRKQSIDKHKSAQTRLACRWPVGSDTSCVPLAYWHRHVLRAAGLLFFLVNILKWMFLAVIALQKNSNYEQRRHCYWLQTVNARRPCNLRERKNSGASATDCHQNVIENNVVMIQVCIVWSLSFQRRSVLRKHLWMNAKERLCCPVTRARQIDIPWWLWLKKIKRKNF